MRGAKQALVVVAGVAVLAGSAFAASNPWPAAHARLSYTIYKPTQTLGYKINNFGYQPCPGGKSKASLYATYGTYKGVLGSNTKGFDVFEGSPAICSDHGEFASFGTRTIGGVKAQVGVYCDPTEHCTLAQGVKKGYILLWKRGATKIQMDGAHITLAQLLKVANSLKPVK
jgi:hypothetical protein